MDSGRMLIEDLALPDAPEAAGHPMDSSRVLLGLMALSRSAEDAESNASGANLLGGVISRHVLKNLLSALHFRDVATVRHCRRVAMLSAAIAQYLGWDGRSLKALEVAALLHDVGKIGVPDNILYKPGKLSSDETALMALHQNIGIDVLQACRVDLDVLEIIQQAHSHSGGAGGSCRRVGSSMHQGARILAVADAYDSLATDQVYREGKPHEQIIQILMASAGTQFDGNVVHALKRWIESEGQTFERYAAEVASSSNPPGSADPNEALEASSLCHIFSYLYLLESLYDGFYLVDSDLRFVVWSRGAEQLTGHPAGEMLNQVWTSRRLGYADESGAPPADDQCPMHRVIGSGKALTSHMRLQHREGHWADVELQAVPLLDRDGRLQGVAEIFRDVSRDGRQPQQVRELKLAASRDSLTHVANRGELECQLAVAMSEFTAGEQPEPFSVIFLDVDHFKSINDTHGHAVGDKVLVECARCLQHETYSGELVGRYGGEEFVILCPATGLEQAIKRSERLRIALCGLEPDGLDDVHLTASFGVAEAEHGDTVESLMRRADKALYLAKQMGRNRTCSLTTRELMQGDPVLEKRAQQIENEMIYVGTFRACITAELMVYKLGGFITEQKAKLLDVTTRRAIIRLGQRGMLPFWGAGRNRQPVRIEVEFGQPQMSSKSASSQSEVTVRISPVGWVRDAKVFKQRAASVMQILRSYFVASN